MRGRGPRAPLPRPGNYTTGGKMFVIRRTDQGGGYVSKPGSSHSYTKQVTRIRKFSTREEADAERCPENEVVEDFNDVIGRWE